MIKSILAEILSIPVLVAIFILGTIGFFTVYIPLWVMGKLGLRAGFLFGILTRRLF